MSQKTKRIIRVFIASPGDLSEERHRAEIVIDELNRSMDPELGIRLDHIGWETHVAPVMGRPEEVILKQVEIGEWDVFVGIVWLRFGSPTGAISELSGEQIQSGTEEEFAIAYKAWQKTHRPEILIYRCTRPPADVLQIEPAQFARVSNFFEKFQHDKEHPGFYRAFQGADEFERRLREDLWYVVRKFAPKETAGLGSLLNQDRQDRGFLRLFLPADNEERDTLKRNVIRQAKKICLIAHSGHSYLAAVGHRFRSELVGRLKTGASFQAILTNPWSDTGLLIALSQNESAFQENLQNILRPSTRSRIDPVVIIEQSAWYSIKLKDSMAGYDQLKKNYGGKVEVRFTNFEMPSTILFTDTEVFFEPYLHINLQERLQSSLLTFEVQVNMQSDLFRHSKAFFEMLWAFSEPAESFALNEEKYKQDFLTTYTNPDNNHLKAS